ncbi:MAG: serine hydrolase domain-containing protein [Planctomycetota bacterium]
MTPIPSTHVAALLGLLAAGASPPAQTDDPFYRTAKQLGDELTERHHVPGIAIASIRNGEVAWTLCCGFANGVKQTPLTAQTVFNVGSVSKVVAAWGAMRLVEQGKIDLDAPVGDYITRWQLPETTFDADGVTLRRILSHTAGLSLHGYPGFPAGEDLPTLEESLAGATGGRGDVRLVHEPGSKCQYSGGGYTIMQLMIEEVSGQDFATFMREQVLEPLAMASSDYRWTPSIAEAAATPHDDDGGPLGVEHFTALAAAGLQTTVLDLARFGVASLARTEAQTAGVLTPETVARMREPLDVPGVKRRSWGLGYATMEFPQVTIVGHTGSNTGWEAALMLHPATECGLVMLTNSSSGQRVMRPVLAAWSKTVMNR